MLSAWTRYICNNFGNDFKTYYAFLNNFISTIKAQLNGDVPLDKKDGYSPVIAQDPELKASHESEEKNMNAGGNERDAERSKTSNTVEEEKLSTSQLITRRGFTLLFSVLMLAVGVFCHFVFPVPEPSLPSRANFTLSWANYSTPSLQNSTTAFWATFNLGLVTSCGLRSVLTPLFKEATGFMLLCAKCLSAEEQMKSNGTETGRRNKSPAAHIEFNTLGLRGLGGTTRVLYQSFYWNMLFFLEERTFYYKINPIFSCIHGLIYTVHCAVIHLLA